MNDRRRKRRGQNPFGGPFAAAGLVVLGLMALSLAFFSRDAQWVGGIRGKLDDLVTPAQEIASAPLAAMRRLGRDLEEHMRVHEENEQLRAENERLRQWYELSQSMRDKMERYEKLLSLNPDPGARVVTARAVGDVTGPFVRARLINAGRDDGVEPGQGVMGDRGLVGRVITAGRRSARVLLLNDLNSRVPVMVERTDVRAILAGDNTARPRLEYLPRGHGLVPGDRIVTSGDGGALPRGLSVGVAILGADGVWRVRLDADDAPIDYVRVIRFKFPEPPEREPAETPKDEGAGETGERGSGAAVAAAAGGGEPG